MLLVTTLTFMISACADITLISNNKSQNIIGSGEIRGYVYGQVGPLRHETVALNETEITLLYTGDDVMVARSTTDLRGRYAIEGLEPGIYKLCWQREDWELGCSENIALAEGQQILFRDVHMKPIHATATIPDQSKKLLWGNVRLTDGSFPFTSVDPSNMDNVVVIDVLDVNQNPLSISTRNNYYNRFVLTDVPMTAYYIRAQIMNSGTIEDGSETIQAITNTSPIELVLNNQAPHSLGITSTTIEFPSDSTSEYMVEIQVDARDPDQDTLDYLWDTQSESAIILNQVDNMAIVQLPSLPGQYEFDVLVQDRQSGFTNEIFTFEVDDQGVKFLTPNEEIQTRVGTGSISPNPADSSSSIESQCEQPPELPSRFRPANYNGFLQPNWWTADTQAIANLYYSKVVPGDPRSYTLSQWWIDNGFDRNGEPVDDPELVSTFVDLTYLNTIDLGIGRDMHCLEKTNGDIACYVQNFKAPEGVSVVNWQPIWADLAQLHSGLSGTVAMTYSPLPNDLLGTKVVKFFAFDRNNNLTTQIGLAGSNSRSVPIVCMQCHGGNINSNQLSIEEFTGDLGASFREFNVDHYCFPGTRKRPNQNELRKIRQLNELVRSTNPNNKIAKYINEWYLASNSDNWPKEYIPQGWRNESRLPEEALNPTALYRNVVDKYCRNCHIALDLSFWYSHKNFMSPGNYSLIERLVCHERVQDNGTEMMPHSKIGYANFWRDELARETFQRFFKGCFSR